MKLSELIAYRNKLLEYDVTDVAYHAKHKLSDVVYTVKNSVIQPRTFTQTIEEDLDNIVDVFDQFSSTLNGLLKELDLMIEVAEKTYYQDSATRYNEESSWYGNIDTVTNNDVNQQILDRRLEMSDETQKMLADRLKSYVNWKYAGLIIRPGKENFINDLVGLDPLYLVDWDNTLLAPSISKFNTEYQNRLRLYIEQPSSTDVLSTIPNNQIGVCLAFNFFEYTPIDVVESYLENIFKKLKPGGTLAMTFNDCDRAHCVALAEKNFCFYTPGTRVKSTAKRIGYQQQFTWNDKLNLTWLELRKPGVLDSLKGGQTLAKILPKTLAKSK
jgi:SAM-dependent methyltransferase